MKKKLKLKKSAITFFIVFLILFLGFIMFFLAYYIYSYNRKVPYYNGKKAYSYIKPEKISDPVAEYDKGKFYIVTDIHENMFIVFVDNNKIKNIVDNNPKIYGYPIKIDDNLRDIVIKDINKTLSIDKKIDINKDNYYKYVTNYYLDNTIKASYKFNYIVFILLLLFMFSFIFSFIFLKKKRK